MKWLLLVLFCPALCAQDAVTRNQEWYAKKAEVNMKATKDGKPRAQMIARNMATSQPMKGYDEIYLVPIENKDERQKTVNFLFEEYSE